MEDREERERQVRLLGLGLFHGVLDMASVQKVADEPDPIESLKRRGILHPEEATALFRLLENQDLRSESPTSAIPSFPPDENEPPTQLPGMAGRSPWDSLPPGPIQSDDSGRHVLRVLTLPVWKQYRNLRFLAEGGMGRVFKAQDPSLKRVVALKFLRRDEPEMCRRFAMEAQHQAMVEHPNICRVYEVGEWQGQSYIAMQYVEGETLEAAMPHLSLKEKIQVMASTAEAIHAAHRAGLIHRDLKPANIMVTRHEHGLEPMILDFGLARGMDAGALTQQGMAMGTIHYMAPEQARGDHARINQATDVYGLGATLHKVLTGEVPFAAFDGMEALRRTAETDVPPLRRMVPDLPEDLDTLTRKCLEKDQARRYESALAVAEDMHRWLAGRPLRARKPTLAYLASKWAKRHKLVMAVAGAALIALLALGGVAVATATSARTRARYAQHFGQEAERIEALLRYSHLLPPHDVRPELDQARARMKALEGEAHRAGRLAEGPAAYALGRSHLALGDPDQAKTLLEAAWSGGLRTPEVSLALGRALALTYQRALDLARALPSKELREAREQQLAQELRDPALARLREGAPAALEAPAYQEALVALIGGHWAEAQAKAQTALAATPWLFEAKRLEGEALLERAKTIQNPDEALPLLAQAETAFMEARRLGPSDPASALGEVRALAERIARELTSGRKAEATLAACREAVQRAQLLRPDQGEAPARLARSLARWVELQNPAGPQAQAARQEALALSAQALALEPDFPTLIAIRVPILTAEGGHLRSRGGDPMPIYQEALELARKAQARHPQDPTFAALVALTCMRKMTREINVGLAPWGSFEEGLLQARNLRSRFPNLPMAYQGLASLWIERAEFERCHGLDPRPSVAAALEACAAATTRGLRFQDPGWAEGDAHLIRGDYLLATLGEGEHDFRRAAQGYRQAQEANPKLREAGRAQAAALMGLAKVHLERGSDLGPALAEAQAILEGAGVRVDASDQDFYLQGQMALLRGRQRLASGRDPGPEWAQADVAFQKSAALSGEAQAHTGRAETRARAYCQGGRAQDRVQALASAREALERDPLRAEAWMWIAVVEQEAARRGDPSGAARAREAWTQTLTLNANLMREAKILGMP